MVRLSLVVAALFTACGPLTPPGADAGSGGGTTGGGGVITTGGGTAQTGGGGGMTGGGGGVTGGGGGVSTGGGGGALAPLSWASMSMVGATSSAGIVGLAGSSTDLWAIQEYGDFFHSSGGAFEYLFKFSGGAKDLYVSGSTVVVVLYRAIRWCTADCTTEAAFSELDLITPLNLFAEATCGVGTSTIAVIVTDTSNNAQLYEWNGAGFTRTNGNLGVIEPRTCWYDAAGGLNVAGRDGVVRVEGGAATPQDPGVGNSATYFYGGAEIAGTSFMAAGSGKVARRLSPTGAWTLAPTTRTPTLRAVGGLLANEVFVFGYYDSTLGNGYRWDGATLRPVGDLLPGMGQSSLVRRIIATSATELYVGGNNSTGPVIVRGRR